MRGVQVAQAAVGTLLLAAAAYSVFVGTVGWTIYTPTSTEVVKYPVWPIAVALAIILFLLFIWDAAGKRMRKR